MSADASKSLPQPSDHFGQSEFAPSVIEGLKHFKLAPGLVRGGYLLSLIGAITFVVAVIFQPQITWASVLLVSFLLVSLGLSGVLMVALQYLTGAGWSVALRRISEALAGLLIPGLIGIAAVLLYEFFSRIINLQFPDLVNDPAGLSLYSWISESAGGHGFTGFKGFWLDPTNWLIRAAIYAGIWLTFAFALRWHSRRQDVDGKRSHSRWNVVLSALFAILFAISYWLASIDWIMSLEPLWFSTMFGVYNFAGLFTGGVACTIILAVWLRNRGTLRGIITDDHLHDLGKLLMAFTTFWAYIWFSEYMLIWYANIPEETEHFIRRTDNLWMPLFYLNVGLNWIIPFLALLPRAGKRDGSFLVKIAVIVLCGRLLDMYLLIMPTVSESTPFASFAPLGIMLGGIGVFILVVGYNLGRAALVPLKDPYLQESLHHHV